MATSSSSSSSPPLLDDVWIDDGENIPSIPLRWTGNGPLIDSPRGDRGSKKIAVQVENSTFFSSRIVNIFFFFFFIIILYTAVVANCDSPARKVTLSL